MWNYIYVALTLFSLLFLSYVDIKERKAPPQVTYGLLTTGLILHGIQSILQHSFEPIIYSMAGASSMFLLAYAIYKVGGWAGGDVKLFAALGAILPFYGQLSQLTFPLPFPVLILAASSISVLPFAVGYGVYKTIQKNQQGLKEDIVNSIPRSIYSAFTLAASLHLARILGIHPASALIIAPLIYISKEPGYPITAFLFTLSILNYTQSTANSFIYILIASISIITGIETYKSMKKNVLRREKNTEDLKEGDIPSEDVWLIDGEIKKSEPKLWRTKGKGELIIDSRKARGLLPNEIEKLKENGIKSLKVKKSLPFIPVLALGFIILLALESFL